MALVHGVQVAIPPPDDYVVDFDNPARQYVVETYALAGVGMVFALFFMIQRAYVQIFVRSGLEFSDGMVSLTTSFNACWPPQRWGRQNQGLALLTRDIFLAQLSYCWPGYVTD